MTRPMRLHRRRSVPGIGRTRSPRRALLGAGVGAAVGLIVFVTVPGLQSGAGAAANPLAGSQGIVTSLPSTSSAVTVSGHGDYSNLKVTVNQTQNLVDQAVSVSWTGGTKTTSDSAFQSNYLQIFQCWGDPQRTDPPTTDDPGPLPTQCQFGGETVSSSAYPVKEPGFEYSRVLTQKSWSNYDPGLGWSDPSTGFVVAPFQAVDGTVVDQQADYNYDLDPFNPKPFWLNQYFRYGTSNEVDFARTYADGTGQQLFQVQTGLDAPGLGCGQSLQPVSGGTKVPQCWIVVVPRGTPAQENPAGVTDENVLTSPLTPTAWANRIAIPIGFNPVGSSCAINATANEIIGNEMAASAASSWQSALCDQPGSPTFSYVQNTDDQARQNLTNPTYGSAGMSVYTDPVDPSAASPSHPIVYAPLTLSGVSVAFNIQRVPGQVGGQSQPDEVPLSGTQVGNIYLTPRLMAKLLTQSYQAQLQDVTASRPAGYAWAQHNPVDLFADPDFLQWNPEFSLLSTVDATDAGTALVEEANSDAASAVWKWILADPEARAWLNGTPDRGMQVNPYYSTNPTINPAGVAFASPVPSNYPKSDPYCYSTGQRVTGPPSVPARPLCILDWSPYALTMQAAAQATGAANNGAKTTFNPALTANTAWTANGPQIPGKHFIISITDTASAARFGLQSASLSRAGDDGSSRAFVAPDAAGLIAGEQAFKQSAVSGVLVSNPSTTAAGAYPLTTLTYAATTPEALTPTQRQLYATFLLYAVGDGQTEGVTTGQLPPGYVPLPGALRLEALTAVNSILHPPAITTTSTPDSSTSTDSSGSFGSADAGGSPFSAATGQSGTTSDGSSAGRSTGSGSSPTAKPTTLGLIHTSKLTSGGARFFLPLALLIGIGAALGALLLGRTAGPATADGPPVGRTGEE
jgi:hypothetical protein